MFYINYNSG